MRPLVTPKEMARADSATIDAGTPGVELMERAGRAVLRAVLEVAGGRYGRRITIVCGPGNNGGDGFVVARLARREGCSVRCVFVGDPSRVKGDPAHHLELFRSAGGRTYGLEPDSLEHSDVIVDALFGTGFHGAARGAPAAAIDAMNSSVAPVVAIDIPSGVDGATGAADGPAVWAAVTVAMAALKVGTAVPPGAIHAGRIEVADIGIAVQDTGISLSEAADVAALLPRRAVDSHKRSSGSVALLGGSAGMSGAIILAARAAMRAGAGYATVGVTQGVEAVVSVAAPEILTRVVSDSDVLGPDALDAFKDVIERADVLAIGPGLGASQPQAGLLEAVLRRVEVPVVVDADGLNVLAGDTAALAGHTAPIVVTPHPGELSRLLGVSTAAVQNDRIGSARSAAERFGCVVVLKGFRSLIADPSGHLVVNPTGGPELATAGTGDVLTGVVAALIGGGLDPFEAAWAATYVHGLAGSIAAQSKGTTGVVAGDVADALPHARIAVASSP